MGLVLNVILMILSFSYYIKKKMKEESVFLVLGIRSRAQTMILVMEYVGCTLLALVLGLAGGRLVLQVLLALLSREASLSYSGIPWYYYLIVTAIYSGAAILAAVINHEIYDWMRYDSAEMMRPRKGKIPGRLTWLAAPVGILLVLQSVGSFASLVNGEDTADQFYFVLGLYFCIICVAGFVVRRNRKKGKHYYRKVFQKLPFLDRFWKNTNVLALLGAAGFLPCLCLPHRWQAWGRQSRWRNCIPMILSVWPMKRMRISLPAWKRNIRLRPIIIRCLG